MNDQHTHKAHSFLQQTNRALNEVIVWVSETSYTKIMFLSISLILTMVRYSDRETTSNFFPFILILMYLIKGSGEARCPNLRKLNTYMM